MLTHVVGRFSDAVEANYDRIDIVSDVMPGQSHGCSPQHLEELYLPQNSFAPRTISEMSWAVARASAEKSVSGDLNRAPQDSPVERRKENVHRNLRNAKIRTENSHAKIANRKYLVWQIPAACDGQGLSDRRACLAVILSEAFLLGRIAVLPTFTLDADRHNHGVQLPDKDLLEYICLSQIPVETVPLAGLSWDEDDAIIVKGLLDPRDWCDCEVPILVRPCVEGFWRNEVHDSVHHLAGELHGQGMKPTSGLFTPSAQVLRAANRAARYMGNKYIGVHVRRGDKLKLMPDLEHATNARSVAQAVSDLATPGVKHVYVASNDRSVDFAKPLREKGFVYHSAEDVFQDVDHMDNHLLFAMEMKLIDEATICIRTFNDSTPFFSTTKQVSHCLIDRSMHDYVFGYSIMGTRCFQLRPPVDLAAVDAGIAYDILCEAGSDRHSFLGVDKFPRIALIENLDRRRYSIVILCGNGSHPISFIEMSNIDHGIYSATIVATEAFLPFRIAMDEDLQSCLYPENVGTWPFERDVVYGPGTPSRPDLYWWLDCCGSHEVRLDITGRRRLMVRQVSV